MMIEIPTKRFIKTCPICNKEFTPCNSAQVYCSIPCRTKRQHSVKSNNSWRNKPRVCRQCNKEFIVPEGSSPIRAYCSEECQIAGYKKHSREFNKMNPGEMKYYNARRKAKYGTDGMITRLFRKYPDLPKCCEADGCNEGRVIDVAHKPAHKRNGSHRVMSVYERHMFWILCPTHHAIIDRGVLSPSEIGLKE